MKKVVFVGNRELAYRQLAALPEFRVVEVMALAGSLLARSLQSAGEEHFCFNDRAGLIARIMETEFDLLISNGCPYILPISKLRKPHQLFLNIHPALLPVGRGKHPINAIILHRQITFGATMHHMDDGVDSGRIVHQVQRRVTPDLDLGLLYRLSFQLEGTVLVEGMKKLLAADFALAGEPQSSGGSYYSRQEEDQRIDFAGMSDEEILRRIRAFSVRSQGVTAVTSSGLVRIFEAEPIFNPELLATYAGHSPAQVLLAYEQHLLVKSRDGIIKLKSYENCPPAGG